MVSEFLQFEPYILNREIKQGMLLKELSRLHRHHIENCLAYEKITTVLHFEKFSTIADLPFIPVSAFKNFELRSIPVEKIYKTLTSSGTSGSSPSKIFLDAETSRNQTMALAAIMQDTLGKQRLPMLIVDSDALLKNRQMFSARGAGVIGMSTFGKDHFYMLDEDMKIKKEGLLNFLKKYNGQKILIFGFTFMVWLYLFESSDQLHLDLSGAILIHSGGWKKLAEKAITNEVFIESLNRRFGLKNCFNFYGMAEQVGSIFIECTQRHLHTPNFADVIIRRPEDFSVAEYGEKGLIQVLSILPESYPGHSLLTEDIGIIHGEDDCECGRKGKYFSVLGRAKRAELRGCSDVYASTVI